MVIVAYKQDDVLMAARKRLAYVFTRFERIVVSVSSGKDSSVLYHLALDEARRRSQKIELFFLDQEAEYQSSIDLMQQMMSSGEIIPAWYQVPIKMTNATSHADYFLHAWEPGAVWVRDKNLLAIHSIDKNYPQRFYDFFAWYEKQTDVPTAFLIGLRSKESLNRFRSISKSPGYRRIAWSTKTASPHSFRFYPLYDWTFGDIWKYIADHRIPYNRYYDRMFAKHGQNMSLMRVSNLIHEKSFRALADLHEFEPDTYDRLIKRIGGVHCAAHYAYENGMFKAKSLPVQFTSWHKYRDYLLASTPIDKAGRFLTRFAKQPTDEETCRMQCQQLLLNDWENNVPVRQMLSQRVKEIWWDRL